MNYMKSNKNKAKLLAAVAVLALAVCSFTIIGFEQVDAEDTVTPINANNFVESLTKGGNFKVSESFNVELKNNIRVDKNTVVDLDGKTITITSGLVTGSDSKQHGACITAIGADLTIKSSNNAKGVIVWTGFQNAYYKGSDSAFPVGENGSVHFENIKIDCDGTVLYPNGNASNVSVKNSEITGAVYAIGTNKGKSTNNTLTVTVEGSQLKSQGEFKLNDGSWNGDDCTVMINVVGATLIIKDSTISGDRQTLFVRAGTATVTNTTINHTGSYATDVASWGGGNNIPNAAVIVGDGQDSKTKTYDGKATLTIDGGSIVVSSTTDGRAIYTSVDSNTNYELTIGKTSPTTVKIGDSSATISGIKSTMAVNDTATVGFAITQGSIIIDGEYVVDDGAGTITVTSGTAKVVSNIPSDVNIIINEGATLEVPAESSVTNAGTITNNGKLDIKVTSGLTNRGTIVNYSEITGKIANANGTVATAPGADSGTVDGGNKVSTSAVEDAFGMSKDLESDYTITSKAFLEKNLTIPEGITLTVNGNATLDLNGQTLTVLGTLVVKNNGVVTTIANGTIEIGKNGKIDNSGIIGKEVPVKVKLQNDENNFVMVNNVIGLGFGMIKTVSGDDVAYAMSISGNVTKKGANAGGVTINGIVNVAGELSIGNGVTLSIADGSTLNVTRNAVLDITSNGKLDYTGTGKVFMLPGATVTLNGESTALIDAETGSFETTTPYAADVKKLATVTVKVQSVKGLVLEVVSTSSYNEDLKKDVTEQRFLLSGEVKDANTTAGGALFQIRGDGTDATFTGNNDLKYKGVYVIDTLAIDKSMMAGTGEGKSDFGFYNSIQFTVLGTVTYNDDLNIGDGIADHLIGAIYSAESTDANGVKSITMYVKPFEAALASIDTAKDKTIDVYGPVEIGTEVKIASGQIIDGAATFNITENGKLTLENGANATANEFNVEGILVVMSDAGSIGTITYNAKITDAETGDVTYYGFQAALNNAKTGDVIEISKATTAQNVTIPEGVTVKIVTGGKLTVNKDLTVNGSLVNQAEVSVTGKTTVNGIMDISETGATTTMADDVNVTGEIVTSSRLAETVKINAVYYQNDDMEFVYTTLDKALKGIADKDVQRYIYQVGKVTDSIDATITNATLYIDGTASLGNLNLDSSRIVVQNNGELTANIIGKTGSETTTGATSEVTFSLSKVKTMNIENTSRANAQNVKVWYTSIASTDSNNYLVGNVTVKSGDLRLADDLNINNADNKMVVDGGLVVPENITLTVSSVKNGLTVNGNIDVIGFVSVSGIASVAGTMNIAKESASSVATVDVASTGTLKLSGSVTIVKDDTNGNGTMTVNGVLFVGTAAKTLGAAASVSGAVTIQSEGFIVAYDGADLTGAEINVVGNESQAKSTTFNINGQPYMTAYAMNSDVTYNDVLAKADIKLVGYDTTGIGSVASGTPAVQYWFPDADLTRSVSDAAIGNTENLYYKATALDVTFQISVGTGISMSIDGIKMTGNTYKLSVGTHSILAVVDPGYKGDVTISFNGQTVTNGQIVVTADMASASYDGLKVISATGNISTDAGSSGSADSSSSDDGMSITDILLIVLVVLIVIMAVLVAIRMMRS